MSEFLKAAVFDLDSSVANTQRRQHLSPYNQGVKGIEPYKHRHEDWIDYAMACSTDLPMMGSIMVMRMSKMLGWSNHVLSGRSEEARDLTEEWLRKHDAPFDTLRLHAADDIEHNGHYKVNHIKYLQSRGFEIQLVVEDWPAVARLIEQELNVPVLVVNPCYEDQTMTEFAKSWDNP